MIRNGVSNSEVFELVDQHEVRMIIFASLVRHKSEVAGNGGSEDVIVRSSFHLFVVGLSVVELQQEVLWMVLKKI